MKRILYALLLIPACYGGDRANTGKCPVGETCSPATPYGLQFLPPSTFDAVVVSQLPVAVGGTAKIALEYNDGDGIYRPLDMPFTADTAAPPDVQVAATAASSVTLSGAATGSNYLRILDASDGALMDRKAFEARELASIELRPVDFSPTPTATYAFATGSYATSEPAFGIALLDATAVRLVDQSLVLGNALPDQEWDRAFVPTTTAGTLTVSVRAGDLATQNLPLRVVDHADAVVAIAPPTTIPAQGETLACFGGTLDAGATSVVGLQWTFLVDGVATQPDTLQPACVTVSTAKTTGTVSVQAHASGLSTTIALAVGTATRTAPAAARPSRNAIDGDRAAM